MNQKSGFKKHMSIKKEDTDPMMAELLALDAQAEGDINGDNFFEIVRKHTAPERGARLKKRRQQLKLSLDDLALALKTDKQTISEIENGKRLITTYESQRFAKALQTTAYWVTTGVEKKRR